MRKIALILLLILIYFNKVQAQSNSNFQVWTDFTSSVKLNEKWKTGGDIGYRIEPSTNDQIVYIRPAIKYSFNDLLNFSVGVANFNTIRSNIFNTTEFRTFQFVVLKWPNIGGFRFKHRIGLEQRFFYIENLEFDNFAHRARYYLEVKSPKFNLFSLSTPFYLLGNFELLKDVNKNDVASLFDHNRFTIGIGSAIGDKFSTEVRYKLISFIDPVLKSYVREVNVLRVRFYYQFR